MYPSTVLGKVTVYDSTYLIGLSVLSETLPPSMLVLSLAASALVVLVVGVPVLCQAEIK